MTVESTSRVDLKLAVGQVEESVTVSADAPLVETSNATLGIVVDEQKIVELPLNGRNFTQLGTLLPGVVAPPAALGGAAGEATPGGFGAATAGVQRQRQRNQSNNFLLDGASNNDTFNTGFVLRPPPDAIQEFKILTHSYSAEYGRNSGSVVNVVTRGRHQQAARRRLGVQPRRCAAGAELFRAADAAEAEAEAEPVRGEPRRAASCRTACSGSATTRASATRAATRQNFVVLSDAQRHGEFRRDDDSRSADRPAVSTATPFPPTASARGRRS